MCAHRTFYGWLYMSHTKGATVFRIVEARVCKVFNLNFCIGKIEVYDIVSQICMNMNGMILR